jgi:hypothetical protein
MKFQLQIAVMLTYATVSSAQIPTPPASRLGSSAVAASETSPAARIIREINEHQKALSDLEHLTDVIGPRLTGSDNLIRAHQWAESTLTARGFSVHREAYQFGPSWTRGSATGRFLTQNRSTLNIAQLAWSPNTPGTVRGDVMLISGNTGADLEAYIGKMRGKILMYGDIHPAFADTQSFRISRDKVVEAARTEGAVAFLVSSGKAEAFDMGNGPVWRRTQYPKIPVAYLPVKDYEQIKRSIARGERVSLELNLSGTTSPKPVQAYNTVAELRGSDLADQIVILGAHFDSWDLGTGATDNGTGSVAIMEALRAIKDAGLTPRRTIRVILFSGEEQGHWGSKAYVADHQAELDKIQAVLIDDLGTGRIRGFALQGMEASRPLMAKALAPLNDFGVTELPLEKSNDSDHASFVDAGVPGFFGVQDPLDYFTVTHHSQFDTFDRVRPEQLKEGAIVMAVTAWELANMDDRLPHGVRSAGCCKPFPFVPVK